MMDCKQTRQWLPAHVDRQLGLRESVDIERHLHECQACHSEYDEQAMVSAALRQHATRHELPGHLEQRIRAVLPREATPAARPGWRRWGWGNMGAALATAFAVIWSVGLLIALPTTDDRLADEIVASHVRSLMSNRLTDVVSSDRHTVKPWFNGKLSFSPMVADFAEQGFPLLGGRLDYVNKRPVAALVYQHSKHPINLYVCPTPERSDAPVRTVSRQGYHLVHWTSQSMTYWVVSDLDTRELESLVQDLQVRSAQSRG